jgi:hypothetical protein
MLLLCWEGLLCACDCVVLGGDLVGRGGWGVGKRGGTGETYRSAFMVDGRSDMFMVLLLNFSGIECIEI